MNLYFIHGENHLASYEKLQEYVNKGRNKGWEVVEISDKNSNVSDMLRSSSLFGGRRLVILKDYKLLGDQAIELLNTSKEEAEVIIYHTGIIPVTFIKKLKNVKKNEQYKLSKFLWKFIDSFFPGNVKNCLMYFHKSVETDPPEMIFSILSGQIRDMFLVLYSDKPLPYPTWRLSNIKHQAEKFGKNKIKEVIGELAEIDLKVKSSSSDLKDELDLYIVRKLE